MSKLSGWQILLILVGLFLLVSECDYLGDFPVYYNASIDLMEEGKDLYSDPIVSGRNYFYGVFFAVLMYPFTLLPMLWANVLYTLISFSLAMYTLKVILDWLKFWNLDKKKQVYFGLILSVFSFLFLKDNLHNSQVTFLMVFIAVIGIKWISENKSMYGSALLGFGVMLKIFPIVFVPYLFYRKWYKAGALTILFSAFFYLLPSLFIGHSENMMQLKSQFISLNFDNERHVLDAEESDFYCLSNWCTTLFMEEVPATVLDYKRNIADVSIENLKLIQNLFRLLFVGLTLFILRLPFFKRVGNNQQMLYEISYLLAITPLIFPHQQYYSYYMSIPAFMYVLHYALVNFKPLNRMYIFFLTITFLLFSMYLIVGAWIPFYDHFKFLIYGSFILVGLLLVSDPQNRKPFRLL